jgi:hypothetical protein
MAVMAMASGDQLLNALCWVVAVGLIAWLLWWGLGKVGLPEPFNKVATVVIVLFVVIFLIRIIIRVFGMP